MTRTHPRTLAIPLAAAFLLAACGGSDSVATDTPAADVAEATEPTDTVAVVDGEPDSDRKSVV